MLIPVMKQIEPVKLEDDTIIWDAKWSVAEASLFYWLDEEWLDYVREGE